MPTYTYQCKKCEAVQDHFHGMSAKPRIKCPACGGSCKRMIGTGAGIIFKGSGFYETDYKTKSGKPESASESKKSETSTTKTETATTTSPAKTESSSPKKVTDKKTSDKK